MSRIYLRKESRRQVLIYLRRVFLPPPSPMLANIYSTLAYDVPSTGDVGIPTKFRFNVGPALQPIAGSLPVNRLRHWPNNNLSSGLSYSFRKHVAFNQCCFNVDLQSSTLICHWNNIGWLYRAFCCCIVLVTNNDQITVSRHMPPLWY